MQKVMTTHSKNSKGITIIEMVVVLAIIAILTSISLFYVNSDNFRLQSETRNFRSDLTYAKSQAVQRNTKTEVKLYSDRYVVRVVSGGQTTVLRTTTIHENLKIKSESLGDLSGDDDLFEFYPDGSSEFNEVRIASNSRSFRISTNNIGRIMIEGPSTL